MDAFDWRASIADIAASGPFSAFAGFDRVIVLLNGDGARLRSSDGSVDHSLDRPLVPFAFAGEDAIVSSLIGSASTDFNVMTRRGAARADVRIVRASEALAACASGVLFAARGTWHVGANAAECSIESLHENGGVWWDGESLAWEVVPRSADGALIAVCVTRSSERTGDSSQSAG
jgi:environmental stress-induced protein Ves